MVNSIYNDKRDEGHIILTSPTIFIKIRFFISYFMQRNLRSNSSKADSSFNFFTPTKDDNFIFPKHATVRSKSAEIFFVDHKFCRRFCVLCHAFYCHLVLVHSIAHLFPSNCLFTCWDIGNILPDSIPIQIPLCKAALYFQCSF